MKFTIEKWSVFKSVRLRRLGELDPEATTECFELMMKTGANIHQEDMNGSTAVHHTIGALAMRLLDTGANPNAIKGKGETVLHLCPDQAVVQLFLEEGNMDTSWKTHRDGHTLLISLLSNDIFPV
jgi:ankyrin repeat protein